MSKENATTVVTAHPNIALIKYWGKRNRELNLPAVGSLSITLDTLQTTTRVSFDKDSTDDVFILNAHRASGEALNKVQKMAQYFREKTNRSDRLHIQSENNFPTAAGLASSASGFAALAVAMDHAWQTKLSQVELCQIARVGSGSAPRSLFGGFVQMAKGRQSDGKDSVASPVLAPDTWPLEVVVAVTSVEQKAMLSTQGMENTRLTSPYYTAWVDSHPADLQLALEAIQTKDFEKLGFVAEHSCLKMHGLMMSANPGLLYWNAASVSCIHAIRAMRDNGIEVFFSIDAGPQIKAICAPGQGHKVAQHLESVAGVSKVIVTGLGDGARVVSRL